MESPNDKMMRTDEIDTKKGGPSKSEQRRRAATGVETVPSEKPKRVRTFVFPGIGKVEAATYEEALAKINNK